MVDLAKGMPHTTLSLPGVPAIIPSQASTTLSPRHARHPRLPLDVVFFDRTSGDPLIRKKSSGRPSHCSVASSHQRASPMLAISYRIAFVSHLTIASHYLESMQIESDRIEWMSGSDRVDE